MNSPGMTDPDKRFLSEEVAQKFLKNPSSVNLNEYMFHEDGLATFMETLSVKKAAPIQMLDALLDYVVGERSAENRIAYQIIGGLLRNVTPHRLKFFDRNWRNRSAFYEYYDEEYKPEFPQKDLEKVDLNSKESSFVFGLLSFYPNGHVREAATKALAAASNSPVIPFLLIRANDWVNPVRNIALKALQRRIKAKDAAGFGNSLPLVDDLLDCKRHDHKELVTSIYKLLGSGESDEHLLEGLRSGCQFTTRSCIRVATEFHRHQVCKLALSCNDDVTRLFAAKYLLDQSPPETAKQLAGQLLNDRFAEVRSEALRTLIRYNVSELFKLLENALVDRTPSVRQLAGFYIHKIYNTDLAEFYRSRLPSLSGRMKSTCILGVGIYGKKEDVSLLVPFLTEQTAGVERAVIRSIAMLDLDNHAELLMNALQSRRPGVSKEACLALQKSTDLQDLECLEQLMLTHHHLHVRVNALGVLSHGGKWLVLRSALQALNSKEEVLTQHAIQVLTQWDRRSYFNYSLEPGPAELADPAIREYLDGIVRIGGLTSLSINTVRLLYQIDCRELYMDQLTEISEEAVQEMAGDEAIWRKNNFHPLDLIHQFQDRIKIPLDQLPHSTAEILRNSGWD
jgi:HEAT repeat protein